jgi:2-C-methyl-D-erythritol 4-phosphate cytidylyltransferase
MTTAIILAGGVGKRLGADRPKQFIEVMGKPIIVYTLEKLNRHPQIDNIEVVCVKSHIDLISEYVEKYSLNKLKYITIGGDTFQKSVKNGVYNLKNDCQNDDVILVHMGISPMVSDEVITDSIEVCKKYGNAFSAEPSYMCMCEKTGDDFSDKYLDRKIIFGLNTPQSFQYGYLYDLYEKAEKEKIDFHKFQHISTLMLFKGEKLYFSKSSPLNIKITTKEDIVLFESLNNAMLNYK